MDDRNQRYQRRDQRSDGYRNHGRTPSYSRQEEQLEDGTYYNADHLDWNDRAGSQMGDSYRGSQITSGRDDYGYGASQRSQHDRGSYGSEQDRSPAGYRSQQSGYGPARFDNGMSYFTSESQGGRDFSRGSAYNRGAGDYSSEGRGIGGSAYARDSYDRNDRGFLARAGDEVASWFGDEDAARRREMDHRGNGPANYKRSDERILEDACDRLTEDYALDARNIQVTVAAGELTLDGTVDSRQAKRRAEDCVEQISGVGHVQNNLRVTDQAGANRTAVTES